MRTLKKNKQKMYYALQTGQVPIYEMDEDGNILYYTDNDGNRYPMETGETEIGYSLPVKFFGNIAMSGGEVEEKEYGLDVSQYDAVLIMPKNALPIDETSLIWFEDEVGYKDADRTLVNDRTADFRVVSVKPSLNTTKYVLKRITK